MGIFGFGRKTILNVTYPFCLCHIYLFWNLNQMYVCVCVGDAIQQHRCLHVNAIFRAHTYDKIIIQRVDDVIKSLSTTVYCIKYRVFHRSSINNGAVKYILPKSKAISQNALKMALFTCFVHASCAPKRVSFSAISYYFFFIIFSSVCLHHCMYLSFTVCLMISYSLKFILPTFNKNWCRHTITK